MADTQITGTLSADEPISAGLSANEGINAELTPNEEISGTLEVKRTQEIVQAVWGTITGTLSDQTDLQSALDGKADLENGKVPSSQLPSYVDDVLEYASLSVFPATGEAGKIYIALDTNKTYRWSGSTYVEISESLALGETTGTAYEGSKGKANADNIASLQTAMNKAYKTDDSAETDLQDADYIPFYDTSATAKKKSLWSNIKAKLNEIFFRRSEANILGAKNLLPLTTIAISGDNIWTIMDDGTVVANGTPSANAQFTIRIPDGLSGNFLFSGCPEGGTGATYDLYPWDATTSARPKKWDGTTACASDHGGTSQEIQIPSGHRVSINCRVYGNFTANNLVFKPMLRLATDTDDTFEPYAMTNKALTDKFGTLGSASTKDVPASGDAGQTEVVLGSDTRLTDARTPTSHTHTTSQITDFPTLATVATSGSYDDLLDKPDEFMTYADNGVLGAKNLLPYPYNSTTFVLNNVTFTDNGDGSVTVGTSSAASADTTFSFHDRGEWTPKAGRYIWSAKGIESLSDDSLFKVVIQAYNNSTWVKNLVVASKNTPSVEVNIDYNGYNQLKLYITVYSGKTVSTPVRVYPMLRLASDSDDTWQPYAMTNRELTVDKCENSVVAPVESGTTASRAYAIGEHFIRDGAFCTAKTAIASGATLTLNTNYIEGQIDASSIFNGKILTSSDNLDNITTYGIYSWGSSYPTNSPVSGSASMEVRRFATAGVHQIVYSASYTFIRAYSGGWSDWQRSLRLETATSGTLALKSGVTGTLGNTSCWKKNGIVVIGGRITDTSTVADGTIVTVPSGFRPAVRAFSVGGAKINNVWQMGSIVVETNGDLKFYLSTSVATQFIFSFTYPAAD